MYALVLIFHILVCFALMAVVLMQSGKGRGLAGAFGGGGGNQTLFGGRGAVDFLGKATWVLGGAFMVTSLSLALLSGAQGRASRTHSLIPKESSSAPAVPGGQGAVPGAEGGNPSGLPAPGGEQAPAPVEPKAAPAAPATSPAPAPAPAGGGK